MSLNVSLEVPLRRSALRDIYAVSVDSAASNMDCRDLRHLYHNTFGSGIFFSKMYIFAATCFSIFDASSLVAGSDSWL